MSTAEQVKIIVAEQLGREAEDIDLDAHLVKDLGADSLDLAECMVAFEQTFKVRISSEQAAKIPGRLTKASGLFRLLAGRQPIDDFVHLGLQRRVALHGQRVSHGLEKFVEVRFAPGAIEIAFHGLAGRLAQ